MFCVTSSDWNIAHSGRQNSVSASHCSTISLNSILLTHPQLLDPEGTRWGSGNQRFQTGGQGTASGLQMGFIWLTYHFVFLKKLIQHLNIWRVLIKILISGFFLKAPARNEYLLNCSFRHVLFNYSWSPSNIVFLALRLCPFWNKCNFEKQIRWHWNARIPILGPLRFTSSVTLQIPTSANKLYPWREAASWHVLSIC